MLAHFGADVRVEAEGEGRRVTLAGRPELTPRPVIVPADPSSAAFPIVAALIVPGSDVVVEGVMTNPLRAGLLTTLIEMGARIDVLDRRAAKAARRSPTCGCARAISRASTFPPLARPR